MSNPKCTLAYWDKTKYYKFDSNCQRFNTIKLVNINVPNILSMIIHSEINKYY